jgi:hypothetical protein
MKSNDTVSNPILKTKNAVIIALAANAKSSKWNKEYWLQRIAILEWLPI